MTISRSRAVISASGAANTRGANCLLVGCSMSTALSVYREAERNLPVRIRIAVPPDGFGSQLDQMVAWLDANCGCRILGDDSLGNLWPLERLARHLLPQPGSCEGLCQSLVYWVPN